MRRHFLLISIHADGSELVESIAVCSEMASVMQKCMKIYITATIHVRHIFSYWWKACMYVCVHACVRACVHACVCVCVRVSVRVCVRARSRIFAVKWF